MNPYAYELLKVVVATVSLSTIASGADSQDQSVFKSDVSRSAVTNMPAFTVDEQQSTKTHTLFMGADIAINLDRDLYGVKDVLGSNWVIEINGAQKQISAKQAPLNLKITPVLKLTETSATIVGYRRLPAYSYDNDPSVKLTRGLTKSASTNADLLAVAENAQYRVDTMSSLNMGGAAIFAGADDQFSDHAMLTKAEYAYSDSHPTKISQFGPLPNPTAPTASSNATGIGPGQNANYLNIAIAAAAASIGQRQTKNGSEPAGRIATMGLDAMDVEFDIRSAKPLNDPYVVTMARFHPGASKPGMVENLVYAQAIHPIDEHLSHVHFVESGFPSDYELIDFQLHIYNRGEEIATNISSNRVELTRDEAFEYVKMEYIGAHPKDTLPAVPVMGKLPADFRDHLTKGQYNEPFYVKVSLDGTADAAYSNASCSKIIEDHYLESVVKRIRFKPALKNGKPVESITSINLTKLAF